MGSIANWLEAHMLTCPIKAFMHFDCPGCGFQRACIALFRGDLSDAWEAYPPIFSVLLMVVVLVISLKFSKKPRLHLITASVAVTCLFIGVSYLAKMF
jgi:hypothetical protein